MLTKLRNIKKNCRFNSLKLLIKSKNICENYRFIIDRQLKERKKTQFSVRQNYVVYAKVG